MVLLLMEKELECILSMEDAIEAVEEGFKCFSLGSVNMPQRTIINIKEHNGIFGIMPAYIRGIDVLGVKVISTFPDNPSKYNIPATIGTTLLNDSKTGRLLALIDGVYITAMRTGAASGVATKYLARTDAEIVGIFGAGIQARTQLWAICEVKNIKLAKVYDIFSEKSKKYAEEMSKKLNIDVKVVYEPRQVVEKSDIVVTASTSTTPLFKGEWLQQGTHINGIGSHRPDIRELDTVTIKRSKVIVDSRDACLVEAGDIIIPIHEGAITEDHIYAEIGEIIIGKKMGRKNDTEITLFKSVGLAMQDVSVAFRAYTLAKQRKVGKSILE